MSEVAATLVQLIPIAVLVAAAWWLGAAPLHLRGATPDETAIIAFECVGLPLMVFGLAKYVFHVGDPWLAYLTVLAAMPTPRTSSFSPDAMASTSTSPAPSSSRPPSSRN